MHIVEAKSLLSAKNGINIYRGCTHGCIYCDSRSACYNMKHDFEDVEVKGNAPELLESALKRRKKPCMVGMGSMSDPYNAHEMELRLTRKILETVYRCGCGVTLITKSARVLDDADILKKINERSKCVIQMTLTAFDDDLCRKIEPNVSVTSKRISALHRFRELGIPTVVWLSPILPFITDTEENLNRIIDACEGAEVKGIVYFGAGLTLRDGNREYFYKKLDENFPLLKEKYIKAYGKNYVAASPNAEKLDKIFYSRCKKSGIMCDIGHIFKYLSAYEGDGEQLSML